MTMHSGWNNEPNISVHVEDEQYSMAGSVRNLLLAWGIYF